MLGILCHTGGSLQEGLLALRITRVERERSGEEKRKRGELNGRIEETGKRRREEKGRKKAVKEKRRSKE